MSKESKSEIIPSVSTCMQVAPIQLYNFSCHDQALLKKGPAVFEDFDYKNRFGFHKYMFGLGILKFSCTPQGGEVPIWSHCYHMNRHSRFMGLFMIKYQ